MKLRIELEYNTKGWSLLSINTFKEYYEKYYKERGLLYDDETESIYYDIDVDFMPLEGQRIGTRYGNAIVIYSILELEPKYESYYDTSLIVVREE